MASDTEREGSPIVTALLADFERWGPEVSGTALAASALDMARALDDPETKPTPRSMLHAQLRMTLVELEKLAPEDEDEDAVAEAQRKWRERRGA
jgi:hypothetical protein